MCWYEKCFKIVSSENKIFYWKKNLRQELSNFFVSWESKFTFLWVYIFTNNVLWTNFEDNTLIYIKYKNLQALLVWISPISYPVYTLSSPSVTLPSAVWWLGSFESRDWSIFRSQVLLTTSITSLVYGMECQPEFLQSAVRGSCLQPLWRLKYEYLLKSCDHVLMASQATT